MAMEVTDVGVDRIPERDNAGVMSYKGYVPFRNKLVGSNDASSR